MTPEGDLCKAICDNNVPDAKKAIESGANISLTRIHGIDLLRYSAERSKRGICELLVAKGADVNKVDGMRKYSLLHHAAACSNFGMASILLDLEAEPNPKASNDATPLHIAARTGQVYLVDKFLNHKANINAQDNLGRTPLNLAVSKDDLEMVKLLVKRNCDLNLSDKKGRTPLSIALASEQPEIQEVLLAHGAKNFRQSSGSLSRVAEDSSDKNPRQL